jgi:hypothetical protein
VNCDEHSAAVHRMPAIPCRPGRRGHSRGRRFLCQQAGIPPAAHIRRSADLRRRDAGQGPDLFHKRPADSETQKETPSTSSSATPISCTSSTARTASKWRRRSTTGTTGSAGAPNVQGVHSTRLQDGPERSRSPSVEGVAAPATSNASRINSGSPTRLWALNDRIFSCATPMSTTPSRANRPRGACGAGGGRQKLGTPRGGIQGHEFLSQATKASNGSSVSSCWFWSS